MIINKIDYNYCTTALYKGYDKIINSGYNIEHEGQVMGLENLTDAYDELMCNYEYQLRKRIFINPFKIIKHYKEYKKFKKARLLIIDDLNNQFQAMADIYNQSTIQQTPRDVVVKGFKWYE